MPASRLNKPVIAIYTAAVTALSGIGGHVYNENIDEWREAAAEAQKDTTARAELAEYLPLARQMTAAMPNAKYPPGPVEGGGMIFGPSNRTLDEALDEANHILTREDSIYARNACELVSYLREVHKIATQAYTASNLNHADIDIAAHRKAAAAADEAAPVCDYKGYEVTLIQDDFSVNPEQLTQRANDELAYLSLKARFINEGAPAYAIPAEERTRIIEAATRLAENTHGNLKDNCNALFDLRRATLDALTAHTAQHTEKGKTLAGAHPTERSDDVAKQCAALLKVTP